jgi:signal transduction histidine kinase
MRERLRNRASILTAALCLGIAMYALLAPRLEFTGITLRLDGRDLVVATVDPASRAYGHLQPGSVVEEVNYAPWMTVPAAWLQAYLRGDFVQLGVAEPSGGEIDYTFPEAAGAPAGFAMAIGLSLFLGIAIWIRRGQAGETLRPLALPLAAATAAPLILAPTSASPSWPIVVLGWVLATVGLMLVADGWVARITKPIVRRTVAAIAVASAVAYVGAEVVLLSFQTVRVPMGEAVVVAAAQLPQQAKWLAPGLPALLAAGVTVVPAVGLLLSGSAGRQHGGPPGTRGASSGRTADRRHVERLPVGTFPVERLSVFLAGLTPIVVMVGFGYGQPWFGLSLPLIWLLIVVFVLQSQARVEALRLQRDNVVAATEAERARLAADLHDDALQEMAVLVRRLDDAGDEPGAALARSIASELREVCGDLRLPVLDELGAGAALEWLVERVGQASGTQVRLERDDLVRPPAEIELAVFRVAQEALANAVNHGAPPILVEYAAASDRASLSVSDQGTGIPPNAPAEAARSGRYGLANMRQRAEQVGARFDVRSSGPTGTAVRLNWTAS